MLRRSFIALTIATIALPGIATAQSRQAPEMPSADRIMRQFEHQPRLRMAPGRRVTFHEFQRRPELRRAAPSIEIQSINFATASADISRSQFRNVEQIARAMERVLRRDRGARFLIEGHTDAVGSAGYNRELSERRAESLKRVLIREFRIPARALETVGYGEDYLLVDTPYEAWENRRVTLRRIDGFLR